MDLHRAGADGISLFPSIAYLIADVFGVDYVPSIFFAIAIILAMYGIFYCFKAITSLQNRVHELAMQVSILNQENAKLHGRSRPLQLDALCDPPEDRAPAPVESAPHRANAKQRRVTMKDVLIIIPAYNEEASIGVLLDKMQEADIMEFADVLVINDASSDKTSWIARHHPVVVISNVFNLGYGSALQLGYKYAVRQGYRYVIQIDADGQHDIVNIHSLYERLHTPDEQGRCPDIVIGSRFMESSQSFSDFVCQIDRHPAVPVDYPPYLRTNDPGPHLGPAGAQLPGVPVLLDVPELQLRLSRRQYADPDDHAGLPRGGDPLRHARARNRTSMHSGWLRPLIYMLIMPLSMFSIYVRVKRGMQKQVELFKDK